jgi:hypothetical protein
MKTCFAALLILFWLVTAQGATAVQSSAPAKNGYSAAALFNQANANARQGKTGLAILNYERARLLAPGDADIAANLHTVRSKAGLPDEPETWLTRGLTYFRPNAMAWIGCLGLLLAGTSILLMRPRPQWRLSLRLLTCMGILLITSTVGHAIISWSRISKAIVMVNDTPARTSPASVDEPAFKLREGETVTISAQHQDFALVQNITGRTGWVASTNLVRILAE